MDIKTILAAQELREKLLADPTRPGYHFAVPGDLGIPGDVNCAFYARGRYHMFYLYHNAADSFRYGHISSRDLLHWRWHPDAIGPDDLDGGIFSGGAFVDDDGTAYMIYWGLPANGNQGGIRIAKSSDRYYEKWEKFPEYMLACTESGVHETKDANGDPLYLGCADPSNIWKKDGKYYVETGCLSVMIKFHLDGLLHAGQEPLPGAKDDLKGDWVDLFESEDLVHWKYLHRFYQRREDNAWTQYGEDDMCPVFLPLPKDADGGEDSGKYLQLFISHNRGCQYYTGVYDKKNDIFLPEKHGRMSNVDNAYFAPEALRTPDGRTIMWIWYNDDPYSENELREKLGWAGVFSLPRSLFLREDGELGIAPAQELRSLRYNEDDTLDNMDRESCEIRLDFALDDNAKCALRVKESKDGAEYAEVGYDMAEGVLFVDSTHMDERTRRARETMPLKLQKGETLSLDIFIDASVIEVFANDRQAIGRKVYSSDTENRGMKLAFSGCEKTLLKVWDIMSTNMY